MGEIGHYIKYHLWRYFYTSINYLQKSSILDISAKVYLKCELINQSYHQKGMFNILQQNIPFRHDMLCLKNSIALHLVFIL